MVDVWFALRIGERPGATKPPLNTLAARTAARRIRPGGPGVVRCRRGVTAVEFAAVSCVLIPMLMGGLELGLQSAVAVALDNAALKASRAGSLGCERPDGSRAGQSSQGAIERAARAAGHGLLNGNLRAEPTSYKSARAAIDDNKPNRGGGTRGAGVGEHTVVYTLRYDQPSVFIKNFTTPWGTISRENYVHTAVVTVQNEPFPDARPGAAPC